MRGHRFDILLGALVFLLLSTSVIQPFGAIWRPMLVRLSVGAVFGLMLLSAVFAVSESRRSVLIALSLALPALALDVLHAVVGQEVLLGVSHVFAVCFLAYTIFDILRFLFARERVTYNTICAAMCAYLLIGVLWANVYSLIEIIEPASFTFAPEEDGEETRMRFGGRQSFYPVYFSFVTLSTLGYGDIVPAGSAARIFAAMEAITGQLYLAVLIAALVGRYISQTTREEPRDQTTN
jgi:hypothetical protein